MVITVAFDKGGSGKTTTAAYISQGLSQLGRTLAIDCDPQNSLLHWTGAAEMPFKTMALADARSLTRQFAGFAEDYEHVVIDTPPGSIPIIGAALRLADLVVVPIKPTGHDADQINGMLDLIEQARAGREQPDYRFLLTQTKANTISLREASAFLDEAKLPRFAGTIPDWQMFANSFPHAIGDLGPYRAVIDEITWWVPATQERVHA